MEPSINLNILLIEDNPGDAFLIKFYLEESVLKYARLLHAEYLNTALDLLQNNEFDVILLDLNLPDSKGIETLEAVLDAAQGSVVIVLTGLNDEKLGLQTVKKGAQDFLVKGQFDGKVLTSSVRYAFERYQLQKQVLSFSQMLNDSISQFDTAQEVGEFGYWELNVKDNSMQWSSNLFSLLGEGDPKRETNLTTLLQIMPPDTAQQAQAQITEAIKNESNINFTFDLRGQKFACIAKPTKRNGSLQQVAGIIKKVG
ncbi:hypothetical protein BH09BAC1_BH09BAC1_22680 [soil metagenome]